MWSGRGLLQESPGPAPRGLVPPGEPHRPGGVDSVMSPQLTSCEASSRESSAGEFRRAGLAWREPGWTLLRWARITQAGPGSAPVESAPRSGILPEAVQQHCWTPIRPRHHHPSSGRPTPNSRAPWFSPSTLRPVGTPSWPSTSTPTEPCGRVAWIPACGARLVAPIRGSSRAHAARRPAAPAQGPPREPTPDPDREAYSPSSE